MLDLYDPMIAKLCVWDVDRESARRRMLRALEEYVIEGPTTLLGFHRALLSHPCFIEGGTCHGIVESEQLAEQAQRVVSFDNERYRRRADGAGRLRRARDRRSRSTAAASRCARASPSRRTRSWRGRRRERPLARRRAGAARRRGRQPDAGHRARRRGRRGRRGGGGPGRLHRRGDEDGERDHGPSRRDASPSCRSTPGAARHDGPGDLRRRRGRA